MGFGLWASMCTLLMKMYNNFDFMKLKSFVLFCFFLPLFDTCNSYNSVALQVRTMMVTRRFVVECHLTSLIIVRRTVPTSIYMNEGAKI